MKTAIHGRSLRALFEFEPAATSSRAQIHCTLSDMVVGGVLHTTCRPYQRKLRVGSLDKLLI